jgi:TctA family transporter
MQWRWMVWDALAILAFTLIGMYFHRHQIVWGDIWHTLLPLYGGWFGLALLLGLYRAACGAMDFSASVGAGRGGWACAAGVVARDLATCHR